MFFILPRAWDKEKILSPHEESNLRPSDSALRCPTTEPQRWQVLSSVKGDSEFFLCPTLVIRRKTSFKIIISVSYLQHLNSQLWKFWEAKVPANKSQNNKFTIIFSPKFEININSGFLRLKHMHFKHTLKPDVSKTILHLPSQTDNR